MGDVSQAPENKAVSRKVITAAVLGGALEWYDFGAYALFAFVISKQFFPAENEVVSLLLTFITFAVGFVTRPLGAIVLGAYSDRVGRKSALSLTMLLMALGMAIIAFCPTYAQIGIFAPIIIVIARLIQGISAGGEIGSALSILVETAPKHKRGQYAAWQQVSQTGAFLVAGLVGWSITSLLDADQVASWGWRVAFAFGMLVAPVGFYIRKQIDESPEFLAQNAKGPKEHVPFAVLAKNNGKALLIGIGIVIIWTVTSKTASSFMPTYAITNLKMELSSPYLGMIVVGIVLLFCPFVGAWSDRIGRKPIMIGAAAAIFVSAYPAFWILSAYPTVWVLIAQQFFYAVLMVFYTAPASAALSELYPTAFRSSGISLSYNIAVTIFGGFSPVISTALIGFTGDNRAIAYYIMFAALVSIIALCAANFSKPSKA
ncbi:MFS transporter [Bartonella sp. HY406]|uniref:MFS transporter n=1 Tax=Bartonella sp. HY406 TaxID=2979331 RepID=UPI0021C6E71B|nr:MFS transporter [Bartonella sp. HY406]UXN02763.1 MFS transporter [Bartonella sp. HY406]